MVKFTIKILKKCILPQSIIAGNITTAYLVKNIISYIISRGSIFSGIILNTKCIKYKSYLKTLYPQVELFLDYYINHGMKDLSTQK